MNPVPLDKSLLTSIACLPEHVIFRIFSFCSLEQILALQQACWLTRTITRAYIKMVWGFHRRFSLWFSDVSGFQRILRTSKAVVSGSQAQQFFDRTYYPDSDMDIYVCYNGVHFISNWLVTQGYTREVSFMRSSVSRRCYIDSRGAERTTYPLSSMVVVMNHDKREVLWDGTERKLRVQLIGLTVDPILHIIHQFHSTGVINYISASVAVSVFPRSTFVRREFKILRSASDSCEWVQKYKNRGFRVSLDNEDGCDPIELSESRTTFDSKCWKVFFTGPKHVIRSRPAELGYLTVPFSVVDLNTVSQAGSLIRIVKPIHPQSFDLASSLRVGGGFDENEDIIELDVDPLQI